jgi:hypothetical protein
MSRKQKDAGGNAEMLFVPPERFEWSWLFSSFHHHATEASSHNLSTGGNAPPERPGKPFSRDWV